MTPQPKVRIMCETRTMKVSLLMFDRLLHKGKLTFNNISNCWQFTKAATFGVN